MYNIDVLRINKGTKKNIKDAITEEVPLTIYLNGKELLTLLCSPDNLKELSVGFLFSNGIINSIDDIENTTIDNQKWTSHIQLKDKNPALEFVFKRLYTSGCGRGVHFYNALDLIHKKEITKNLKISAAKITELMNSFKELSITFKKTGGVHSAALSDGEDIVVFKEDIGRHNAIDKVIGEALIKNLNMEDLLVLTSGRISSEIILKVQKTGSCLLISRSAPTDQAVKLAKMCNLTLVGFVRGQRMNTYSAYHRIGVLPFE